MGKLISPTDPRPNREMIPPGYPTPPDESHPGTHQELGALARAAGEEEHSHPHDGRRRDKQQKGNSGQRLHDPLRGPA